MIPVYIPDKYLDKLKREIRELADVHNIARERGNNLTARVFDDQLFGLLRGISLLLYGDADANSYTKDDYGYYTCIVFQARGKGAISLRIHTFEDKKKGS